MPVTLVDLSLELVDRILFVLDPLDIARVSEASRFFHEIIYGPLHQQFWRGLYLAQPLDDPRRALTHLGTRREDVNWKGELQRIVKARTVLQRWQRLYQHPQHQDLTVSLCGREERCEVLQTCIDLVTNVLPIPSPDGIGLASRNVRWLQQLIGEDEGGFLERETWIRKGPEEPLSEEEVAEEQLLARLHALYGLTRRDMDSQRRRGSQAFVYSLRNHTAARRYGPFLPEPDGDDAEDGDEDTRSLQQHRVDWVFIRRLLHDFQMLLLDTMMDDEDDGDLCQNYQSPLSLWFCQSIIPRGLDLDKEQDWAGVEGLWSVRYAFMDHREFILYNDPSVPDHEPQDTSIFDDTEETLATIDIYFRVTGTEPDPSHPTRPKLNLVGEVDGKFNMIGFVKITDDNQLWWHYGAGNDNQMVWNCDAIASGSVRSRRGFIGIWSTIFHDVEDPIGPFWMQRELLVDEED